MDKTHLIVLQAVLGPDDLQDVATIAVEEESASHYNLHIQGETEIYGENYYIVPTPSNFSAWGVIKWLFSPGYRVYSSPYYYRAYPNWWSVRHPLAYSLYRGRVGIFATNHTFQASRTFTVKTLNKVAYQPRVSTLVVRHPAAVTVVKRPIVSGPVKRTVVIKRPVVKRRP
jgi:hypothetical protein